MKTTVKFRPFAEYSNFCNLVLTKTPAASIIAYSNKTERREESIKDFKCVYPNLKERLEELHLRYRDLANVIGVSEVSVYRRVSGETKWSLFEVIEVCRFLETEDAQWLFKKDL